MSESMSEADAAASVVLQGTIATLFNELERRRLEVDLLSAQLAATEAVCVYSRHNYGCDVGNLVVCDCGYTEAQNKRQALLPKPEPKQ